MKYHEHCVQIGNGFVPSPVKKFGQDYLEFSDLPDDTIVELIGGRHFNTSFCLLWKLINIVKLGFPSSTL